MAANEIPVRRAKKSTLTSADLVIHPIEVVAIDLLKPHPQNYKSHPEAQLVHVGESLRENGFYKNVVTARDGTILAGHGVVNAARQKGAKRVPIVRLDIDPDSPQAFRIIAGDNEMARLAVTDDRALALILKRVNETDLGLLGTGFDDKAFAALLASLPEERPSPSLGEDEVPPMPTEVISKTGDLYLLGKHRVLCGSSTIAEDMRRLMDGKSFSLLWTDPPYNVQIVGGSHAMPPDKRRKAGKHTIENDSMGDAEFRAFLTSAFQAFDNHMAPGAVFYISHGDTEGYNFRGAVRDVGWKYAQSIVWVKDSLVIGRQDYQWIHEPILYGWKAGAGHMRVADRSQTTVWNCPRPRRSDEHPTMKPPELIERSIKNSSRVGDIVLDGFGGSGSTLVAAERTGREARLMEIDPRYVDVIVKRWETLTGEKAKRVAP